MHNFQATSHFPDKKQKNHLTVALGNDHRPYAKFYIGSGIALHNQWIPDLSKIKTVTLRFRQKLLLHKLLQIDEIRISGKR